MGTTEQSSKKKKKPNAVVKKGKKAKVLYKNKKPCKSENDIIENLRSKYEDINSINTKSFADLPLSPKTLKGLKDCSYLKPTDIQKETIGLALQGKDILGASLTGSGKTLAFLIPILETLFCKQWTKLDGLGALIITPTRELAYQIFETLRKIGRYHNFSAGLVIGGKDLKIERQRMDRCNIIICTPGRLLHHMDENPLFDCVNLQILVLDEADRCLDMGFKATMDAIIENLPSHRQTLLFSATQTKSVKDLARLSLKDPSYVSVHEHLRFSTPEGLTQSYVVCDLKDKISILWTFIRNHRKQKVIIFFATCKEVRYVFEIFNRLGPGVSLMPLYGTLHIQRRMNIYDEFHRKESAVLFATDIAARGLDFPEVNWVIQADCPEDASTYIHRVGRTARYSKGGESLLLLLPSEIKMIDHLKASKIPIEEIEINPLKLINPARRIQCYLAKYTELIDMAKRAVIHYIKSVNFMKDKKVFDVLALDVSSFALSLGLTEPPTMKFLQRLKEKRGRPEGELKNNINEKQNLVENVSKMVEDSSEKPCNSSSKKSLKKDPVDYLHGLQVAEVADFPDTEELQESAQLPINMTKISKRALTSKILNKKIVLNRRISFDDDDDEYVDDKSETHSQQIGKQQPSELQTIEKIIKFMTDHDEEHKKREREILKFKRTEKKRKLKKQNNEEESEKDEFGTSESDEEPDLSWLPDL